MSDHPRAERLEALAAGDDDAATSTHLAECAACRAHVAELRRAAADFAGTAPRAADFAREIETRTRAGTASPSFRWRPMVAVAPALLMAVALVLMVRARSVHPGGEPGPGPAGSSAPGESVRFKGARPLAVIRERAGEQARFVGSVTVRPGDALRIEIAVDVQGAVAAGLLGEDGSFVELIAPRQLAAGTHFSELAARFDEHPTPGWLIAGEPASVEQARKAQSPQGTSSIRVEVE